MILCFVNMKTLDFLPPHSLSHIIHPFFLFFSFSSNRQSARWALTCPPSRRNWRSQCHRSRHSPRTLRLASQSSPNNSSSLVCIDFIQFILYHLLISSFHHFIIHSSFSISFFLFFTQSKLATRTSQCRPALMRNKQTK